MNKGDDMAKIDSLFDSLGERLDKLELEIIHLGNEIDKVKRRLDVDISIIEKDVTYLREGLDDVALKANHIHYRDF